MNCYNGLVNLTEPIVLTIRFLVVLVFLSPIFIIARFSPRGISGLISVEFWAMVLGGVLPWLIVIFVTIGIWELLIRQGRSSGEGSEALMLPMFGGIAAMVVFAIIALLKKSITGFREAFFYSFKWSSVGLLVLVGSLVGFFIFLFLSEQSRK